MKFRSLIVVEDGSIAPIPNADPKLILTQPVLNFIVPFVPTQLSFSIFAAVSDYQLRTQYPLEIIIINNDRGKTVNRIPWVVYEDHESEIDIPLGGFFLTNLKNLIIENEGTYTVELLFNGEVMGSTFFSVYHVERES